MIMTRTRLRQIGWGVVLGLCIAAFVVLAVTVHAARSEVVLAEKTILNLEKKKQRLETEFQARASQHQLARLNQVDLGYEAPRPDQYVESRMALAALGQPLGPGAPSPIRVARADLSTTEAGPQQSPRKMVSPVSGRPVTLAALNREDSTATTVAEAFGDFLVQASPIRAAHAQTVTVAADYSAGPTE